MVSNERHYHFLVSFSFFFTFLDEQIYILMNLDLVDDFRSGNWIFTAFKSVSPACQIDRNGDFPLPTIVQLARCGTEERQS